ncbi:MAG: BadF/BadG/BcrA/BcrD ATPase family protein [Candidatus Bathyarchaeia archaeon]
MIIVAVDGGKTKTSCVVFNEDGEVISTSSSGPSGLLLPSDTVKKNLWTAISGSLSKAGLRVEDVDVLSIGLADIDTKHDVERASLMVKELPIPRSVTTVVEHDAVVAYYAVTYGAPGVAVIAGTGSIAFGMNKHGERARSGGWNWLFGDEGSGYWIAKEALQAAARAFDGRGPKTVLVDVFLEHFKISDPLDMLEVVYRSMGGDPLKLADLAVLVDRAAEVGDEVAIGILERAGVELALACYATALKLGMVDEPMVVGTVGSVFKSKIVEDVFYSWLKRRLRKADFKPPLVGFQPIIGSAVIGFRRLGFERIEERIENLKRNLEV